MLRSGGRPAMNFFPLARLSLLVLSLSAAAPIAWALDAPASLVPPAGQVMLFDLNAVGAQVYECAPGKSGLEWTFRAPEATLADAKGRRAGNHYGGPTWESPDGSKVVGEVV